VRRLTTAAVALALLGLGAPAATGSPDESSPTAAAVERRAPDGVLVRWAPGLTDGDRLAALRAALGSGAPAPEPLPLPRWVRIPLPAGTAAPEAVRALSADPRVELAEPDAWFTATSDDPGFPLLWGLQNTGQVVFGRPGAPGVDVRSDQAVAAAAGRGGRVLVAVLDSGVDIGHPDLAPNVYRNPGEVPGNRLDDDANGFVDDVTGWDFVNGDATVYDDPLVDEHGTHVAGTTGAVRDNRAGVAGVTDRAVLLPVKFLGQDGAGRASDAVRAVRYASGQRAAVLNASFGGPDYSAALEEAIATSGAVVVAAAGNEGADNDVSPSYPASYGSANVLATTAVGNDGSLPTFANTGRLTVDVGAPGEDVASTVPAGRYVYLSGTSMAAPHASAVAALVRAVRPDLSAGSVVELVRTTGRPLASLQGRTSTGRLVDAEAAVRAALDGASPAAPPGATVPVDGSGSTAGVACPDGIPSAGFVDTTGSVHRYNIDCAVWYGLARGTSPSTFEPQRSLTRGQVATLLAGVVELAGRLPASAPNAFSDDDGDVHEPSIDRLAALGVIQGITPTRYEPARPVSRAQIASLVVRVQELLTRSTLPARPTTFVDILLVPQRTDIEKATAAGLVNGKSATTYDPAGTTTRAQAVSLVARQLQGLVEAQVVESRR
jgi:subtilisin family serine protease